MNTENAVSPTKPRTSTPRTNKVVVWIAGGGALLVIAVVAAIALLNMPTNWFSNSQGRVLKALPAVMLAVVSGRPVEQAVEQVRFDEDIAKAKANCAGEINPDACLTTELKAGAANIQKRIDAGKATEKSKARLELIQAMLEERKQ